MIGGKMKKEVNTLIGFILILVVFINLLFCSIFAWKLCILLHIAGLFYGVAALNSISALVFILLVGKSKSITIESETEGSDIPDANNP